MWQNVETLRGLSHILMWATAVFAILAAAATWSRYYVDRRVGELSAAARAADDEKRELARGQREAEIRAELHSVSAPRRLSEEHARRLGQSLKAFAGQRFSVVFVNGSPDASLYAGDFALALSNEAGWVLVGKVGSNHFSEDPIGVEVTVNIEYMERQLPALPAAKAMTAVLAELGLVGSNTVFASPGIAMDMIDIRIGHKPLVPKTTR